MKRKILVRHRSSYCYCVTQTKQQSESEHIACECEWEREKEEKSLRDGKFLQSLTFLLVVGNQKNVLWRKNKRQPVDVDRESFVVRSTSTMNEKISLVTLWWGRKINIFLYCGANDSFMTKLKYWVGRTRNFLLRNNFHFYFYEHFWTHFHGVSFFYCTHFGVIKFSFYYFHVLTINIHQCCCFHILISDFSCSFGCSMFKYEMIDNIKREISRCIYYQSQLVLRRDNIISKKHHRLFTKSIFVMMKWKRKRKR